MAWLDGVAWLDEVAWLDDVDELSKLDEWSIDALKEMRNMTDELKLD